MPGGTSISYGNIRVSQLIAVALTPAIVAANTVAEQTFTIQGLLTLDAISVSKPTTQTGLGIVNCRVSAANTVAIAFINATGAGITPTAGELYTFEVNRPDIPPGTPLPAALV